MYLFIYLFIYLKKIIKGWQKDIFGGFCQPTIATISRQTGDALLRSSRHVFNATYSSNGRPGIYTVQLRELLRGSVRELKREGRTRESFQDDNNTTTRAAVALLTVYTIKKKKKKKVKERKGRRGEDSQHFLYSASSSFPEASTLTFTTALHGCDSKESRKWHIHTLLFLFSE